MTIRLLIISSEETVQLPFSLYRRSGIVVRAGRGQESTRRHRREVWITTYGLEGEEIRSSAKREPTSPRHGACSPILCGRGHVSGLIERIR